MSTESYTVTAVRWNRGWELHIADADGVEIGVTQSRNLAGAERMVRDYLAVDDRDAEAPIEVRPELDEAGKWRVERARKLLADAETAQRHAAEESRALVRDLKDSGMSGPDIARVLNLSSQRVSQLAASR